MVAQVETEINKVETPPQETLPPPPPENDGLVIEIEQFAQILTNHRQLVDKSLADLKSANGHESTDTPPETPEERANRIRGKIDKLARGIVDSAYHIRYLANSSSSRQTNL